jgi:uncharacterized protein YjbJ (UPF0337 family)
MSCGLSAPSINSKVITMNKDQAKGAAKDVAGKVQEKTGKAVGSPDQEAKGRARQAEGKLQKAYGDVKAALRNSRHE